MRRYIKLTDLVDHIFPPLKVSEALVSKKVDGENELQPQGVERVEETFNDFNYWRFDPPAIELPNPPVASPTKSGLTSALKNPLAALTSSKNASPVKPQVQTPVQSPVVVIASPASAPVDIPPRLPPASHQRASYSGAPTVWDSDKREVSSSWGGGGYQPLSEGEEETDDEHTGAEK
jgi:hypothetical protein